VAVHASDYEVFNGTSCATPYAAGVCALIKSANPSWTPTQIRDRLRSTAQDVTSVESGTGWDRYAGYGMVDAAAAVGGAPPEYGRDLPEWRRDADRGSVATITWTGAALFDGEHRLLDERRLT
jgi:subtilisin family serine protease